MVSCKYGVRGCYGNCGKCVRATECELCGSALCCGVTLRADLNEVLGLLRLLWAGESVRIAAGRLLAKHDAKARGEEG
jgi:hypothetical protein